MTNEMHTIQVIVKDQDWIVLMDGWKKVHIIIYK